VTEKGNRSGHDNDLRAPIVSDGHRRTPRYAKPPKEVVDTFGSVQRDDRCPHFRFHRCFRRRACPSCITSIVIGSPMSFQQTPVTHGDGKSTSARVARQSGTCRMSSSLQLSSRNRLRLAADRHQGMMDFLPWSGASSGRGVRLRRSPIGYSPNGSLTIE
jgi:hypothetical protein